MRRCSARWATGAGLVLGASLMMAQTARPAAGAAAQVVGVSAGVHWVGSWAASQQVPEPANALPAADLEDATLRETVHLSAGGSVLRVHLSNAFGTTALHVTAAHVARPVSNAAAKIDAATDRALTFAGAPDVTVPPGAEYLSDPVNFPAAALSDVTVSFHLEHAPARETGHPGSRAVIFYTHGDATAAADMPEARTALHWYVLSGIDVAAAANGFAVVAFGDSITDGHGATTNGNDRWTDVLAARLQAAGMTQVSVLNHGIGGNHMLTDGLGPNALARFDRDVLAQTAARYVILLEGINDIGYLARETPEPSEVEHTAFVHALTASYAQFVERAHARGLVVIGATILPFVGSEYYHPTAANEADRQAINAWIRAAGHFDAVVDLDRVTADPKDPSRMRAEFDSGDHLHPSPAGYKAMGAAIPLALFR